MQLGDALRYSSGACDALGQPVQGKGLPEFVFCPAYSFGGFLLLAQQPGRPIPTGFLSVLPIVKPRG
jgi:hypothetical protein